MERREIEIKTTYLHYINTVVRKPKNEERHNNGLNKVLTPYPSLEHGLSQAAKDTHITADYNHTWHQEAHHCFKCVLKHCLFIKDSYV